MTTQKLNDFQLYMHANLLYFVELLRYRPYCETKRTKIVIILILDFNIVITFHNTKCTQSQRVRETLPYGLMCYISKISSYASTLARFYTHTHTHSFRAEMHKKIKSLKTAAPCSIEHKCQNTIRNRMRKNEKEIIINRHT